MNRPEGKRTPKSIRDITHLYLSRASRAGRPGPASLEPFTLHVSATAEFAARAVHAANIALALAEACRDVAYWEFDSRLPNAAYFLGLSPEDVLTPGLEKGDWASRSLSVSSGLTYRNAWCHGRDLIAPSSGLLLAHLPALSPERSPTAFRNASDRWPAADARLLLNPGPASFNPRESGLSDGDEGPLQLIVPIGKRTSVQADRFPQSETRVLEPLEEQPLDSPGQICFRRDPRGPTAAAYRGLARQLLQLLPATRRARREGRTA